MALLIRDNPMEIDPSLRIISKKKGVLSETFFYHGPDSFFFLRLAKVSNVYSLYFEKKSNVDFFASCPDDVFPLTLFTAPISQSYQ